jgi:ATP-dependent DNA helicase DinG
VHITSQFSRGNMHIINNELSLDAQISQLNQIEETCELDEKSAQNLANINLNKFSQFIDGYKPRAGQNALLNAVARTGVTHQLLVAQAGTGTGKTFAYLLGALPFITHSKKRLVVSTHTIALQTQLIEQDLPLVQKHLGSNLKIEIAKGSGRYFCPNRAYELLNKTAEDVQTEIFDHEPAHTPNQQILDTIKQILSQFEANHFCGDLDKLEIQNPESVTHLINRQFDRCTGRKSCQYKITCPYYCQKDRLVTADIIVTNHALLSNVLINGNNTFGDISQQLVVIDEAHQFHDIFRAEHVNEFIIANELEIIKNVDNLNKAMYSIIKHHPATLNLISSSDVHRLFATISPKVEQYQECVSSLNEYLFDNFKHWRGKTSNKFEDPNQWLLDFSPIDKHLLTTLSEVLNIVSQLNNDFSRFSAKLIPVVDKTFDLCNAKTKLKIQSFKLILNKIMTRFNNVQGCLARFVESEYLNSYQSKIEAGLVRWITYDAKNNYFTMSSNDLIIADTFQKKLVARFKSVVLTSATIESMGSFEFFCNQLGIDTAKGHKLLKVLSPFDYSTVQVSAPILTGDVNHHSYSRQISQQVTKIIYRHKAILVLFSSYRQLNEVYQHCSPAIQKLILTQKSFSKQALIETHKQRIDQGLTSILFGVDGLSEGIDLKKHYLTCVAVAKFPFPHLNEPMTKFQSLTMKAKGINDFRNLSLPICSKKLIQSVGRLIRTEDDYGEVLILDSRANTTSFGKELIRCLPFFDA